MGKGGSPQAEIAATKGAFADATEALAHGISVSQRARRIELNRELRTFFDKEKIISLEFLKNRKIPESMLNPTACTKGIERASKTLTERFSQIIPNCAKVEIKPLGIGSYGQGYKLEFLDADGKKLIHDKVLKVFYQDGQGMMDFGKTLIPAMMAKSQDYVSQFSLRDIVRMWNNIKNISMNCTRKSGQWRFKLFNKRKRYRNGKTRYYNKTGKYRRSIIKTEDN